MLIFVLSIDFQQKHSRLLTKEVVKIKPAICVCECHDSKLGIYFKETNLFFAMTALKYCLHHLF
jgi:hypothetical protein